MTDMTRKQARELAQDNIMDAIRLMRSSGPGLPGKVDAEAERIFRRLEKQFGYEPGSFESYI